MIKLFFSESQMSNFSGENKLEFDEMTMMGALY